MSDDTIKLATRSNGSPKYLNDSEERMTGRQLLVGQSSAMGTMDRDIDMWPPDEEPPSYDELLRDTGRSGAGWREREDFLFHTVGPSCFSSGSDYPIRDLDLRLKFYEHRRLGARDVIVHNIMQAYLFPKTIKASILRQELKPRAQGFKPIKGQDRNLGLDLEVLTRTLFTCFECDASPAAYNPLESVPPNLVCSKPAARFLDERVLHAVKRYYLEVLDPHMRAWLRWQDLEPTMGQYAEEGEFWRTRHDPECAAVPWKPEHKAHLKSYRPHTAEQQRYFLFSGIDPLRSAQVHYREQIPLNAYGTRGLPPGDAFLMTCRPDRVIPIRWNISRFAASAEAQTRRRHRRSASLPLPGAYDRCFFQLADLTIRETYLELRFPTIPLRELDRRSRRRSLSRRNIRDMFHPAPESTPTPWRLKTPERPDAQAISGLREDLALDRDRALPGFGPGSRPGPPRLPPAPDGQQHPPCANCGGRGHRTRHCSPCGFCGSPKHLAPSCRVAKHNRCKCGPFPTYHTAARCRVLCSRPCGSPWPVGHFRHRNAMTCRYRCCMCGLRGHAGADCNLRRCRCGAAHLGQDCCWNPTCRSRGCDRYLCRKHCQQCGSTEKPFVGLSCARCRVSIEWWEAALQLDATTSSKRVWHPSGCRCESDLCKMRREVQMAAGESGSAAAAAAAGERHPKGCRCDAESCVEDAEILRGRPLWRDRSKAARFPNGA